MMVRVSEVIRGWLGWCPNAAVMRMSPGVVRAPPVILNSSVPDGGTGGPGRISRGASLAVGSLRILFRNLRLLIFSFLTGLVMIFSLATNLYLQAVSGTNPFPGMNLVTIPPEVLIAKGSLEWVALTFAIGFISSFLTYILLAGLLSCVSSIISEKACTFREGLARAGGCMRSLAAWAVVGSLLGTAGSCIMTADSAGIPVVILSMGAIYLFFILTIFVVPAIVVDGVGIVPAIRQSLVVFRKIWGEIIVCFGILLLVAFVIYLLVLIPAIYLGFSSAGTASVGLTVILTMLVMMVLMFIGSTVSGIASLGLYACWKDGGVPPAFAGTAAERESP